MVHRRISGLAPLLRLLLLVIFIGTTACGGCDDEETPTECPDGTIDCPCREDSTCDDGLVCTENVCTLEAGERVGLTIATESARACELLFVQTDADRILSSSYGENTAGALRRRDPNVAVAVSRRDDSPFDPDSVSIVVDGNPSNITVTARCFDASGAELADADVRFN